MGSDLERACIDELQRTVSEFGILLGVVIILTIADVAVFGAPRHPMTALLLVLVSALVAFNARRAPNGAS